MQKLSSVVHSDPEILGGAVVFVGMTLPGKVDSVGVFDFCGQAEREHL
jgi:hypothetical protein